MCYRRTFVPRLALDAVDTPTGCRLRREPWIRLDRTAIEGEKPLRYKERGGRRSQVDSCTGLALDAVGTPTGCRLRREPWIRLDRTAIEGEKPLRCKERGGGEGHRCTLVPVLPSMPSLAFSSRVIRATRPGADSAKDRAACTLGSMEPGAN